MKMAIDDFTGLCHVVMKPDLQTSIKEKLFQFRADVMEKILLGVAGVGAEMGGGKMAQALFAGTAAREI